MKTLLRFMCLSLLAIVMSACSGNGPENIAVDFTRALYTADSEKAVSYCTNDTKELVGMIMGFASSKIEEIKKTDPEIKVIGSQVSKDGNSAEVDIEIKNYFDFSKGIVTEEIDEQTVNLKKVDGEWKVALTK